MGDARKMFIKELSEARITGRHGQNEVNGSLLTLPPVEIWSQVKRPRFLLKYRVEVTPGRSEMPRRVTVDVDLVMNGSSNNCFEQVFEFEDTFATQDALLAAPLDKQSARQQQERAAAAYEKEHPRRSSRRGSI
jgi:hypothetical protein